MTPEYREWQRLERLVAEAVEAGEEFLPGGDAGNLRLVEGQPVLDMVFGLAWQARARVLRSGGSVDDGLDLAQSYRQWPSQDALAAVMELSGGREDSVVRWQDCFPSPIDLTYLD